MPPREATHVYADYFTSLDVYEHNPIPVGNANGGFTAQQNTAGGVDEDEHGDEDGSSVSFVMDDPAPQQSQEQVDPLSIDPTSVNAMMLSTDAHVMEEDAMEEEDDAESRIIQRRRLGEHNPRTHNTMTLQTPPRGGGGAHTMLPWMQPSVPHAHGAVAMAVTPGSPAGDSSNGSVPDMVQSTVSSLSSPVNNTSANTSLSSSTGTLISVSHNHNHYTTPAAPAPIDARNLRSIPRGNIPPPPILRFCPRSTTITDLKYFAERGCIVPLLAALETPRLVALGARLLADYAKCSTRRVAVASNMRILEFLMHTMVHAYAEAAPFPSLQQMQGTEYAVECVRSLTATEESDMYLLQCCGMLDCLAQIAGGSVPSVQELAPLSLSPRQAALYVTRGNKSRLHACIAIMNLSCGKTNKKAIASHASVLQALVRVMSLPFNFNNRTAFDPQVQQHHIEVILKGVTCVKNLSNADINDAVLLGCAGLVSQLGQVSRSACLFVAYYDTGDQEYSHMQDDAQRQQLKECAQQACTNACLALMNLSISKSNKYTVFKAPGIMESLMCVLLHGKGEARVKACSALSNLAIGYSNKVPMLHYPGFVQCILQLIQEDEMMGQNCDGKDEQDDAIQQAVRTKACSILWSFAAESKNQVPVVQRGDILPVLVKVAREDSQTEARFKCIAALTLLAESPVNAIPLLEAGSLAPLMSILAESGPDPTCWTGQTPSWCVGFLMNLSQSQEAVPYLREAGVIELLAPLLTLEHYQSLKAAMACTFILAHPSTVDSPYALNTPQTYDLLRQIETTIPKIISLLTNTLQGKGGAGYKYGVFTLRSSVGCIAALSSFPDFIKGYLCTPAVIAGLGRVVRSFCVDGGVDGSIVGGGRDDWNSASLGVRALHSLISYLIPNESCTLFLTQYNCSVGRGSNSNPGASNNRTKQYQHQDFPNIAAELEFELIYALKSFALVTHAQITEDERDLAKNVVTRLDSVLGHANMTDQHSSHQSKSYPQHTEIAPSATVRHRQSISHHIPNLSTMNMPSNVFSLGQQNLSTQQHESSSNFHNNHQHNGNSGYSFPTFILTDRSGRRFTVPYDLSGGRAFNDCRVWCYRRGRFCYPGESPDPNYAWTQEMHNAYEAVIRKRKPAYSQPPQQQGNALVQADNTNVTTHTTSTSNP